MFIHIGDKLENYLWYNLCVSFTHPAMFLLVMLMEGFGEGGGRRDVDGTEVGGDSGTCDPLFCF